MKFNSVAEYFFFLSNRCLVILLVPVVMLGCLFFGMHYFLNMSLSWPGTANQLAYFSYLNIALSLALVSWSFWSSDRKLKHLQREPSLATRLDNYATIAFFRLRIVAVIWFMVGLNTFIWNTSWLITALAICTLLAFYQWPTRKLVAFDLKLNSEEREVLNKRGMGL